MFNLKEERGFTLIEMMIVLLIISVLILIAIPNVTKHSKSIDEKGCSAYISIIDMKDNTLCKWLYISVCGVLFFLLIDLAAIIAHIKKNKIEVLAYSMKATNFQRIVYHCSIHSGNTCKNFLINPILSYIHRVFKRNEGSFYCLNTVETPLFAVLDVRDEQPLSILKKHVKSSELMHKLGYITNKPFPCLRCDEKARTAYLKGLVGLSAC